MHGDPRGTGRSDFHFTSTAFPWPPPNGRRRWKGGGVGLLGAMLVMGGMHWQSMAALFPDPNLESAVRRQVFAKRDSDAPLVEEDVVNISTVEGGNRGITNLAGLEKCRALAMLELPGNQVSDLTPLEGLSRLQFVDLQSNRVANLAPLGKVTALQYLQLAANVVKDLAPLAGLTNLSALYLSGNRIEDVKPLRDLHRLASLYLDRNRLEAMDGVEGLHGLSSLSLSDNRLSDLEPITGLTEVRYLFLERNRIQDLSVLVTWVKSDTDQRFAPYLNLYLAGNPLGTLARERQVPELEAAGVRVHR